MKLLGSVNPHWLSLLIPRRGPGDVALFDVPRGTDEILARMRELNDLFFPSGQVNPAHPKAEEYALCLLGDGRAFAAAYVFRGIIRANPNGVGDVLVWDRVHTSVCNRCPMIADASGKLGLEGAFRCAELSLGSEVFSGVIPREAAIRILTDIVYALRYICYPLRPVDIRLQAIESLLSAGVSEIDRAMYGESGAMDLAAERQLAREGQA